MNQGMGEDGTQGAPGLGPSYFKPLVPEHFSWCEGGIT